MPWDARECLSCPFGSVGHRGEVWAFDLPPKEDILVTGSVDQEVRVFALEMKVPDNAPTHKVWLREPPVVYCW